ncbi:MAG: hypothetical protein QW632_02655 [Ignisphaera sp.]
MISENSSSIIRSFLIGSEKCPVCGSIALTYLHLYQAPHNETVAIVTIKCDKCGFKYSTVLSIATSFSDNKCIEIEVSDPQDLRTLIYLSDNTTIEIPDIGIKVDLSQLRLGSIVTVDAILSYLVEWIENAQHIENNDEFAKTLLLLKSLLDENIDRKIKIVIRSDNGVGIINSYRKNYSRC